MLSVADRESPTDCGRAFGLGCATMILRPPCDPLLDVFGPRCPQCGGPTYVSIVSAVVLCVSEACAWTYRPTTMALLAVSTRSDPRDA